MFRRGWAASNQATRLQGSVPLPLVPLVLHQLLEEEVGEGGGGCGGRERGKGGPEDRGIRRQLQHNGGRGEQHTAAASSGRPSPLVQGPSKPERSAWVRPMLCAPMSATISWSLKPMLRGRESGKHSRQGNKGGCNRPQHMFEGTERKTTCFLAAAVPPCGAPAPWPSRTGQRCHGCAWHPCRRQAGGRQAARGTREQAGGGSGTTRRLHHTGLVHHEPVGLRGGAGSRARAPHQSNKLRGREVGAAGAPRDVGACGGAERVWFAGWG